MGNMSYCRFENTSKDLDDCIQAIENNEISELNEYEIQAIKRIQYQAKCIIELENQIEVGVIESKKYNDEI